MKPGRERFTERKGKGDIQQYEAETLRIARSSQTRKRGDKEKGKEKRQGKGKEKGTFRLCLNPSNVRRMFGSARRTALIQDAGW